MLIQISSLWDKFIIVSAYSYQGDHNGDAKYDISVAIPNFTVKKYSLVTGIFYSFTYGTAILFAGAISDKYPRKILLFVMGVSWNLT